MAVEEKNGTLPELIARMREIAYGGVSEDPGPSHEDLLDYGRYVLLAADAAAHARVSPQALSPRPAVFHSSGKNMIPLLDPERSARQLPELLGEAGLAALRVEEPYASLLAKYS